MQDKPESLFFVPTEDYKAKVELSYLPGVYAALVEKRKELRIKELAYQFELDKIKEMNYFKERVNNSQKDAEKAAKLSGTYESVYQDYILVYVKREEIEGYMRALEIKSKALDLIIRSEIGDKYLQK